jgi:HK97 family phage major capsid protein
MDIQKLRELKAAKADEARKLQAKEQFTDEDQKTFESLVAEVKSIESRIQVAMELDGLSDPKDALSVAAQAADIKIVSQPKVYANLGEQLMDVMEMTVDGRGAPKARERYNQVVNAATGASTGIDADGGYLVETDRAAGILSTAIETGVLASRCSQQPISANADSFSYLAVKDRNRTTRSGLSVYRKGEADAMSSSGKVGLAERELRLEDMYGVIYVTNRMLRDAVAMSEYIKRELRKELAFKLDYEIFQGNGAGQCLGIINSGLPVSVAKEAGQANDTIVAENVVKMLGRFKGNMATAAWFVNQDCLPMFPLMKVGDTPVFVPGGSFANAPFGSLLGLPIIPIEFCQTIGDKWDIILGDFSEYLLIRKGGVEEAESMHVRFLYDEMAFRFITRNNGQPMHDSPITPLNGSNTLSPFVTLDAR